jgi:hypothetical protein
MSRYRLLESEILKRWQQLTPQDLEPIHLDQNRLADLLTARYDFSPSRAKREVESLIADFDARMRRATAA